jgi:hypothetical protein
MQNKIEDAILVSNTRKPSILRNSYLVVAEAILRVVCEEVSDVP